MFSNAYKPIISGVVRSINLYAQGLQTTGHFVSIFAPDSRNYEDPEPFIFRYPAIPLPTGLDYALPVLVAPQIDWLVPRLKLDIIHTHHPVIVGREALNFSRNLGLPLVFTFHTMYHEYTHYLGLDAGIVKLMVKRMVGDYARKADHIIAPSAWVRDMLPLEYNVDRPVDILPTPIDLSLFPPRAAPPLTNPNRIQLIYVGRIAKEKNIEFLVRAFARAHSQDPRLRLRVIGDGPDLDKLRNLAAQLGQERNIYFAGMVPFEQVPRELLTSDMFVFSSVSETQGLVVLEAMAACLPLVLVHSEALFDVARPGIDAITTPENEDDFAQAIIALVRDPARAVAMGQAARATAEQYSVAALTGRLLAIYQNVIESYHRSRRL